MFVIELIYKADLSAIDAHMKPHVAFLKKHYDAGRFLEFRASQRADDMPKRISAKTIKP